MAAVVKFAHHFDLDFNRIGNLADPQSPAEAATKAYVDTAISGVSAGTVADGSITYAKMQDVSATDKLLGRQTAGSGDVEEVTCSAAGRALLDDADASAQRTTLGLGTAATQAATAFSAAGSLTLTEAPADLGYTGMSVAMTYGASITPTQVVYFDSTGVVLLADANASGKFPALGMAMETASSGSHVVLLAGIVRNDAWAWTVGGLVYLSATAGGLTQTAPAATDDCIQILGVATHADRMFFNPQLGYVTHT